MSAEITNAPRERERASLDRTLPKQFIDCSCFKELAGFVKQLFEDRFQELVELVESSALARQA